MVLVFDVDDTLYEELTFVKSGFMAVCNFINEKYNIDVTLLYKRFVNELDLGRGKIFDNVLTTNKIYSKKLVRDCLSVYRLHKPNIKLYDDAREFIIKHINVPKYIVTDGNKIVQWNKVKTLGLDLMVKHAFITHRYGIKNAKPSPFCFHKICKIENEIPQNIIYFGDNPNKDFVGIKKMGFKTVRLIRGNYAEINPIFDFDADISVASFKEVTDDVLLKLLKK
jgi:putative hydrolase of the HAD superfamily